MIKTEINTQIVWLNLGNGHGTVMSSEGNNYSLFTPNL